MTNEQAVLDKLAEWVAKYEEMGRDALEKLGGGDLTHDQERVTLLLRALELRKSGERDAALSGIEEAHRRFPEDPAVSNVYALLLHEAGRSEEALTVLRTQ